LSCSYLRAARTPGVLLPLIASFAGGGLPIGMLTLAVLLLTRLHGGSFAQAGVMAAALSAGNAVGVALQGAMIDRRGQTRVLVTASVACLSALVALVVTTDCGGPAALLAALAATAGAAFPATPSSMRALWTDSVPDPGLRMTGYALSAVSFTAATVLGPVLVSGLLLLGGPQAAVLTAAGLAGGGGLVFAATPASRSWTPTATRSPRQPLGKLGPGMRTLIVGNLAIGLTAGLGGVAVPAAAIALGAAALAGVFAAAGAAGDLVGGLAYGARRWRLPLASRLVAAQCGSAAASACLALAAGSVPGMLLVMPAGGAAGALQGITTSALLDDVAEPGKLTGSYALVVSCGLAGSGAGYAIGGALIGAIGIRNTFLTAAVAGVMATGWYVRRRHALQPRPASTPSLNR
jgi:MFS family permease